MKINLYSVRDNKLGSFFPPIAAESDLQATRRLIIMRKDEQSQIHHFPGDYDMYRIAEMDTDTGVITPTSPVEMIASGVL